MNQQCRNSASQESLAGTAPHRTAWLAIEERGSWPRNALVDSTTDELRQIAALASAFNIGVLLIRNDRAKDSPRHVIIANHGQARGGPITSLQDILMWDWTAIGQGHLPPHGSPIESTALVCVHGTRDQCCAIQGRALIRELPHTVEFWESSHIGGHRFAPVVLHLPSGYVYGRLTSADLELIQRGEVVPAKLRGCSYDPPAMQVAEQWVRLREHLTHRDDVARKNSKVQQDTATVTLLVAGNLRTIELTRSEGLPRLESCGGEPTCSDYWSVIG